MSATCFYLPAMCEVQIVSQLVMEFLKRVLPKFEAEKVPPPRKRVKGGQGVKVHWPLIGSRVSTGRVVW